VCGRKKSKTRACELPVNLEARKGATFRFRWDVENRSEKKVHEATETMGLGCLPTTGLKHSQRGDEGGDSESPHWVVELEQWSRWEGIGGGLSGEL
jgi:hypothetical protein